VNDGIDFLEHGGGARCQVRLHGELFDLPDPRERHYQWVLLALSLEHVPGTPLGIAEWQRQLVFERWCAAWDLPSFHQARRLAYLVDKYRAAISNDLAVYTHLDLGELWRARRWQKLVDLIDRLPAHSWYNASVANDEEHAAMLAEAYITRRRAGETDGQSGPALTTWTPEVAELRGVHDAVRRLEYTVMASQHGKKAAGEPPKPLPRPMTAVERAMKRAEHAHRQAKHESLVARVLPQKAAVKGESNH